MLGLSFFFVFFSFHCNDQEEEIMARGMGAYMGVAQGAVFPPKFIHLTYR